MWRRKCGVICRARTGACGVTFRCAAFTPRSPSNGCPGRSRTCTHRVNSAPLSRLSYWTMDWYRPADSNGAPLAYRASALPAELDRRCLAGAPGFEPGTSDFRGRRSPAELRPGCLALPLRFERSSPVLQTGAVTRSAREAMLVPPASIRTGALLITKQVLCRLSYAGRGGSASIRTKDFRVMSPVLWSSKLRNLVLGGGTDPPTSCL